MDRQSKIINIIIVVGILITIGVCLFFILNIKDPVERDIYLVEQKDSLGTKIVSDNSYYKNIEKTEKQTIIYSAKEDESMLNPEDTIVPGGTGTNKTPKDPESPGIISYVDYSISDMVEVKPITDEVNPIKLHEDGEIIEILEEEDIEEGVNVVEDSNISKATLLYLLINAAEKRNENRIYMSPMTQFQTIEGNSVYLNISQSMPVILMPLNIDSIDVNFINYMIPIIKEYSDRVYFMFVGYSLDGMSNFAKIRNKIVELGITENIPLYYDNAFNVLSVVGDKNYQFLVFNYDSYSMLSVLKTEYNSNSLNIEEIIKQYQEEKELAINDANNVEREYIESVSGDTNAEVNVDEEYESIEEDIGEN